MFFILFSASPNRNLLIDPELVAYAYATHNYRSMNTMEQLQLNILRLEVDRIRYGIRRVIMLTRSVNLDQESISENITCAVCFEAFTPLTNTVAATCGHVYCRRCYNTIKARSNLCGVCRQPFGSSNLIYRLYLRFNFNSKVICRLCMCEINKDMIVKMYRCGDVFCERCFNGMSTRCLSCRGELGGVNRPIQLIFSFH